MVLPHKVWIKGRTHYLVVWVDRFDGDNDKVLIRGECCPKTKTIYLRRQDLTPEEVTETFVHEIFHAIEFEYKLKIAHALIYKLEKIIVKLLIKNGATVQWESA